MGLIIDELERAVYLLEFPEDIEEALKLLKHTISVLKMFPKAGGTPP